MRKNALIPDFEVAVTEHPGIRRELASGRSLPDGIFRLLRH
jgi:hypothetical protein